MSAVIILHSGKLVDLFNLKPQDIEIEDIAHSLSRQCRYNGHCPHFYSVAEHSVIVSREFTDRTEALVGLLHDAAEAYIGDIVAPLKRTMLEFNELEHNVLVAISKKFGLEFNIDSFDRINMVDKQVGTWEYAQFFCTGSTEEYQSALKNEEALQNPFVFGHMPPEEAQQYFMKRFKEVYGHNA